MKEQLPEVVFLWPLGNDEMTSLESITVFGVDVQYKWSILSVTEQCFLKVLSVLGAI